MLLVVAVVVFLILRLTPGDPAAVIAGNNATSEDIDRIREQLGLTRPLLAQFGIWVGSVLRGDLGYLVLPQQAGHRADRAAHGADALAGRAARWCWRCWSRCRWARWPRGAWAAGSTGCCLGFSVAGFSVPVFVVGYVLIYLFAMKLQWFPVQGYRRFSAQGVGAWRISWCCRGSRSPRSTSR